MPGSSLAFSTSAMLVIYDANCPVCRRARAWLEGHDPGKRLEFLACASEAQRARAPQVSEVSCREAMQLVLPDGRVFAGAEAIERILPALPPPWRWLGIGYKVPGGRFLAPLVYGFVARNRMAISGMMPGHSCKRDGACDIGEDDGDGRL